jgi:antitoxin Phd
MLTRSKVAKRSGSRHGGEGTWQLQDAKARFSEVVRKARAEGPQHVSVRGKAEAVVISAEEFERLSAAAPRETGARLVEIMRDPRIRDLEFGRDSVFSPIRDVPLFEDKA